MKSQMGRILFSIGTTMAVVGGSILLFRYAQLTLK
jgi:hypothetical protein